MSLSDHFARHRRSLLALLAIGVFAGIFAAAGLPVSLLPNIAFPRIQVNVDAGDRPVDQTDVVVTRPLEQALRAVPGVTELRSTTSRGSAELRVAFAWGADMNLALQRMQAAVAQAGPSLPAGVRTSIRRMDGTVFPVAAYSLTSARIGPVALRRYAELTLTPLLSQVSGVARVDILGGGRGEYRVQADIGRLRAYGLTLSDISAALAAANVLDAPGKLEDRGKLYLTVTDSHLRSAADIEATLIKTARGGLVRLGDIASVRLTSAPAFIRVSADGKDAVSVQVYQQPSGDTVRIVNDIRQVFVRSRTSAPGGLKISPWYDQSELITTSANDLVWAIAIGAVLAALVLLAFLRNLRVTLAAVIVVPTVLALTSLILAVLGQSFNIMTLGGMAAAIGLIIDDAIVMIEHMERRLHEGGDDHLGSLRAAAAEFLTPLAGSSAATILIFLPLAFLSGVTGAFFKALALTMATSLVASFVIAWLIVPILVERLFAPGRANPNARRSGAAVRRLGEAASRFATRYSEALSWCVQRPRFASLALIPLALAGGLAFFTLPSGFMPKVDEGGFILDYIAPPGTSISESDRLVRQIESVLATTPEVATFSRRSGAQLGSALTESNVGDFFVRLKNGNRRGIEIIMAEVRGKVQAQVPGVDVETAQLMEDLIGDLTSTPQPIVIKLYGEDSDVLRATAQSVAARLKSVRGTTEVRDGIIIAGDAINVRLDPVRTALEGLSPAEASRQVASLLSGEVATHVIAGPLPIDVRVWIAPGERARIADVSDLPIRAGNGQILNLSRIADVSLVTGQAEVNRAGGRRVDAVTARVVGRDMGGTAAEASAMLSRPGALPTGVSFEMGGLYAEQQAAFSGLAGVFVAAIAVVTVLLLMMYENWRVVISIILMPLAAACAVGAGLWLAAFELNIMALMGLTMVIGIVTEVAIFYFTEYTAMIAEGLSEEAALVAAGQNRLRPIAMTTLAAILALIPLALGGSMQQPLAVAIIIGLIAQGPLVLLVMPSLFRALGMRPVIRSGSRLTIL